MPETSLHQTISEEEFFPVLQAEWMPFARVLDEVFGHEAGARRRADFWHLIGVSEELESFLDDHGAAYNRTFGGLRELVASVRGWSLAGFSLTHLGVRLEGYGLSGPGLALDLVGLEDSLDEARAYVSEVLAALAGEICQVASGLGLPSHVDGGQKPSRDEVEVSLRLPYDLDTGRLEDEGRRVAEVTAKYLQTAQLFERLGVVRHESASECEELLLQICTEERVRVYEASVHNLQSFYDTYVRSTDLEARDPRLACLRGHVSVTLHLLEAVMQLVHFVERHESRERQDHHQVGLNQLVSRRRVAQIALNHLFYWADQTLRAGVPLAEALLPLFTRPTKLAVALEDGLDMHARPVSLIVGVVSHYGTPVSLELAGSQVNCASILELMIAVGSNPEERSYVFEGDARPLRDLELLFQCGLGEHGLERLPAELLYLRRPGAGGA